MPHSTTFDADAVKAELGLVDDRFENFASDVDALAGAQVSDETVIQFFIDQYAKTDDKNNVQNEKHLKRVTAKLMHLYRRGPGADLDGSRGTMWGAVNAITRFEDFDARARSNENRFNSAQFGVAANRKTAAFNSALELIAA